MPDMSVSVRREPPKGGWIRAIREALGMDLESFAKRLSLRSASAALQLERNADSGAITLRRLRDAADALHCDLHVDLIPREPLQIIVEKQAERQARTRLQLERVAHSMELEAQPVDGRDLELLVQEVAEQIAKKGGADLWR